MFPQNPISQPAIDAADKILKYHGAESTPKALAEIVQNAIDKNGETNKIFLCQFEEATDYGWHASYKRIEIHVVVSVAIDKESAERFAKSKFPEIKNGKWNIQEINLDNPGAIHLVSTVCNCGK